MEALLELSLVDPPPLLLAGQLLWDLVRHSPFCHQPVVLKRSQMDEQALCVYLHPPQEHLQRLFR
jgi:hypothetical protein